MTSPKDEAKPAPVDVLVDDDAYEDTAKGLCEEARRDLGDKVEGMHFCLFCGATYKPEQIKRRGYVPVMKPTRQGQAAQQYVDEKGQELWMIPERIHRQRVLRPAREAASRLRERMDGMSEDFPEVKQTPV